MTARLEPMDAVFGAGAVALAAALFGVALSSLATPKDYASRLAVVSQQTERAQSLLASARGRGGAAADALCGRDALQQARLLYDLVSREAPQAGLVLDSLESRAEPAPEASQKVTPVRLRFSVTGSYEAALGLLALVSRERPQLFVDSLDLTPKVSNVTLSLSGRVFCAG